MASELDLLGLLPLSSGNLFFQKTTMSKNSTSSKDPVRIETATIDDLDELTTLVVELLDMQGDFTPNKQNQEHGLRLVLESPNRGRIFALRNDNRIIGMVNLLFTISTAEGGMVILLEDFIIHPDHRGQGYGEALLGHVHKFAEDKNFKRITLLTDKFSPKSQRFFSAHGYSSSEMVPMRKFVK